MRVVARVAAPSSSIRVLPKFCLKFNPVLSKFYILRSIQFYPPFPERPTLHTRQTPQTLQTFQTHQTHQTFSAHQTFQTPQTHQTLQAHSPTLQKAAYAAPGLAGSSMGDRELAAGSSWEARSREQPGAARSSRKLGAARSRKQPGAVGSTTNARPKSY